MCCDFIYLLLISFSFEFPSILFNNKNLFKLPIDMMAMELAHFQYFSGKRQLSQTSIKKLGARAHFSKVTILAASKTQLFAPRFATKVQGFESLILNQLGKLHSTILPNDKK